MTAFAQLVLAHGAGAGSQSEFMQDMARELSALGVVVHCFDFDYMQVMQKTGKRRPPDKIEKLQQCFLQELQHTQGDLPLFIGGKSMGGRVASMILQHSPALAGICLGYPFHPVGKPDKLRVAHLQEPGKPLLVLQGQRDTFGNDGEIPQYALHPRVEVAYLPDGDHSFKPRKASGFTQAQHVQTAAALAVSFMQAQI